MVNAVDSDQMSHSVASDLGLPFALGLSVLILRVSLVHKL